MMDNSRTDLRFLMQLDDICVEYETLFKQGGAPRIEDFLDRVPAECRSQLVHELVALEVALSRGRGDQVSVDDVVSRYAPLLVPSEDRDTALRATVEKALASTAKLDPNVTETVASQAGQRAAAKYPRIEGFEIQSVLGKGGMGIVFRAIQTSLGRPVALKMILHSDVADECLVRFEQEAKAVAELNDPHFVQIYELGEANGLPYMALELVDGGSLEQYRHGEPQAADFAAQALEHLARGMQQAHAAGLVHRDLKPHNVLMTRDGKYKIADFGLVKRRNEDAQLTRQGSVMGTASYMAPEQSRGAPDVGPAADIHALGGILYCLLTGRPPFLAATVQDTIFQVRHAEAVPPSQLNPKVPKDLETICLKCLQKEPQKRYESAEELAEDLRRFRAGEPIKARPVGVAERAWRWCRRNPRVAIPSITAAALALALMIGGPIAAILIYQQKQIADTARNKAQVAEGEATEARDVATRQGELALESQKTLVDDVQRTLENQPRMQDLRRRLLETALKGLAGVVTQDAAGGNSKTVITASAYRRMGDIQLDLGQTEKALEAYQLCHATVDQLSKEDALPNPHHNLSLSYSNLGEALRRAGNAARAKEHFLDALRIRREWKQVEPTNEYVPQNIAETLGKIGNVCLMLGQFSEARDHYREAFGLREQWLAEDSKNTGAQAELAGAYLAMGRTWLRLGLLADAEQYTLKANEAIEKLAQSEPDERSHRWNLAIFSNQLGAIRLIAGKAQPSADDYTKAMNILQELSDADPPNALLRRHLAEACYGLGIASQRLNNADSTKYHEKSLQLRQRLVER